MGVAAGVGAGGRRRASSPAAAGAGSLRGDRRLGHLAGSLLGGLLRHFVGFALRCLFLGLAGLFLAPARLLGGGQDGDLLLFAFLFPPLGLAARRLTLLLDEGTLPRRLLSCRQGARDSWRGLALARRLGRAGRCAAGRLRTRRADRSAFLAHLDLHDLGPAMAEALSHGAGVNSAAEF